MLGAGLMQQVPYAPSNFGLVIHATQVLNNVTSNHNPSVPQTKFNSSAAPHDAQRVSGPDLLSSDATVLIQHPRWLPCVVPGCREVHYIGQTDQFSHYAISRIVGEPDDWVIVRATLLTDGSHN
ncbi:hypothetical protein OPQ81_008657 [Rhizoctonia solani]|nr:hypothetical protein OPQ81_008657 [Rhizoctonia solani]